MYHRSVTFRFGSLSLSRVAARAAPIPYRSFSTSPYVQARGNLILDKQKAPRKTPTAKNDLAAAESEKPPVNTEAPITSRDPEPDSAPASSAEVPPNADMPPPPPAKPKSSELSITELMQSLSRRPEDELDGPPGLKKSRKDGKDAFSYDANSSQRPIDLDAIVAKSFELYMSNNYDPKIHDPMQLPNVRSAPVTGRTIFVDKTSNRPGKANNPEAAFKKLDTVMGQNKIKVMWHQQRFAERPGMKRKRLKMARWKRRFRFGFIDTARRVKELKNQGW